MIYQLAKTSVGLSGQVRLDLVLRDEQFSELHLVPVSDDIIYNESNARPTLNYSHVDNINYLYKQIADVFYRPISQISSEKWIYSKTLQDTYDSTYRAGLKRMRYDRYHKRFSFLSPIWIREADFDAAKLEFHICLADSRQRLNPIIIPAIEKKFKLSPKLIKYFNTYFNQTLKSSIDDLINIKFDIREASVSGIDVVNRRKCVKDISYILNNLVERERPLLEFDSNLLEVFEYNKMIAAQLLNFNLVFDPSDLFSYDPTHSLHQLPSINMYVDVYYDNKKVDFVDLDSNYEFIPKLRIDGPSRYSKTRNVLDYLEDYLNLSTVYSNKIVQNIFHWSYADNPESYFNLYNGFSPIISDKMISGLNYNQSILSDDRYNEIYNNVGWSIHYDVYDKSEAQDIISFLSSITSGSHDVARLIGRDDIQFTTRLDFTALSDENPYIWINNNKYHVDSRGLEAYNKLKELVDSPESNLNSSDIDNFNIINVHTNDPHQVVDSNNIKLNSTSLKSSLIIHKSSGIYLSFLADNNDNLTLPNIIRLLDELDADESNQHDSYNFKIVDFNAYPNQSDTLVNVLILNIIYSILKGYILPDKVEFRKSVYPVRVGGPTAKKYEQGELKSVERSAETQYLKVDDSYSQILYRYFGRIYPKFSPIGTNQVYRYRQFSDINSDEVHWYNKLLADNWLPYYPSIGFYSLISEPDTELYPDFYKAYSWDVSWLKDNQFRVLPVEVKLTHTVKLSTISAELEQYDGDLNKYMQQKHQDILRTYLSGDYYQVLDRQNRRLVGQISDEAWSHIWQLYKTDIQFDYETVYSLDSIIYKITYILR